ncbi:MAG: alkaline phosphatase D family protein [Gemmatimonadota bacterium]|nr:alkaline phosphatase D family protein [Gemmatimonadota bacterium]
MARVLVLFSVSAVLWWSVSIAGIPFNAMGEIAGEVGPHSVILKTRLTEVAERDSLGYVPGAAGWVSFEVSGAEDFSQSWFTSWLEAVEKRDYNVQENVGGLAAGKRYFYRVHIAQMPGGGVETRVGPRRTFRTAPDPARIEDVAFAVVTSHRYKNLDHPDGFESYRALAGLRPDFIALTGDDVYYDNDTPPIGVDISTCRHHWHRMYSLPRLVNLFSFVPAYFEKDDHDYRFDDADPYMPAREGGSPDDELGRRVFLEQVPMGDKTCRRVRWGAALEFWLPEVRDYRSPNDMPDGPAKTVWGVEQRRWLKRTILESSAMFKILLMQTPLLGPDRGNKKDNHANRDGFFTEGREFLDWLSDNKVRNFYIVCGDRHWKYHSVHRETGFEEFCCGALTNGASVKKPDYTEPSVERKYYLGNGGFLMVRIKAAGMRHAEISFDFYDKTGSRVHAVRREYVP